MKYIFVMMCTMSLVGRGTVGGAMQGASEDLNRAGNYVKNVGK